MRTLLLNASGEFLGVVPWQTAVGDLVVGNVKVLREYDKVIHSQSLEIKIPAVVREVNYVKARYDHIFGISHSKRNIFIRDHFTCQYCGFECSRKDILKQNCKRGHACIFNFLKWIT